MPRSPEIIEIDVYKKPIYKLCDFLLRKRQSFSGRGLRRPISFHLNELNELFEYIDNNNEIEKIKIIGDELKGLSTDTILLEGQEKKVIEILNLEVFESFVENFGNNTILKINCTSEYLEMYQIELRKRTEALKRKIEGVQVSATTNDGACIDSGTKKMTIRKRDANQIPIAPYLVLLLAGKSLSLSCGPLSISSFSLRQRGGEYEDYEKGDFVGIDFLQKIFSFIDGNSPPDQNIFFERKKLTDSLRGINKNSRSEKVFGVDIFKIEGGSVQWIF